MLLKHLLLMKGKNVWVRLGYIYLEVKINKKDPKTVIK